MLTLLSTSLSYVLSSGKCSMLHRNDVGLGGVDSTRQLHAWW